MKKSILALSLAGALVFSSCEQTVEVDTATLQSIVNQAVTAALAQYPTIDQAAIANAAAQAAAAAVAAGFDDQDIQAAIAAVLAQQNAAPATWEHSGLITADETWYAATEHFLNDKVVVADGATLTIEAGAVIKGRESDNPEDASALVVARGGKIYANGTADAPIIFTSENDNLDGNLTSEDKGLWGGVIVLGKAKISVEGDGAELQIEGIPAEDTFGLYGGSDDQDNSGVIKYVSIRHGGANIGEGNEINGLTCGGVGSGTSISNVEVYANKDDGIEMFGGTVNITNAVVWNVGDDSLDTDQAYSGTISNVVIMKEANGLASGDHGLELDGAEGSYQASNPVYHTIKNVTYKGGSGEIADLRAGVRVKIQNLYAFNMGTSEDIELDNDGVAAEYDAGNIIFENLYFNLATGDTRTVADIVVNKGATSSTSPVESDMTIVTTQADGVGADTSVFTWTLAEIDF